MSAGLWERISIRDPIRRWTYVEQNENIYLDLDKDGNLVSMTIEHAKTQANLPELFFQQFEKGAA